MMRITENTLIRHTLRNLENNYSRMGVYLKELSSGRKVNLPSDDPAGIRKSLDGRVSLSRLEQFNANIQNIQEELRISENTISNIQDSLLKAKEISVKALSLDSDASLNSQEMEDVLKNIVKLANTSYQGRYLFSGFKTNTLPFILDEQITKVDYKGDSGQRIVQIGENRQIALNNVGSSQDSNVLGLFVDKTSDTDIFKTLIDLRKAISEKNTPNIKKNQESLNSYTAHLSTYIQQLGAKQNDLGELKDMHDREIIYKQSLISGVEQVDFSEASVNLTRQENAYKASLAAAAKSNFHSLFDFLF